MPLHTPPQLIAAKSHSTHSITVFDRIDTTSPACKPSASRPWPISLTASAVRW
jgi:hypothetical protein